MNRRRYTHLLKPDADLFALYLDTMSEPYTHIDFDVRVGLGRDPGPDFPTNIRQMAIHLSQRRIDAVGFHGDHIDIIEITTSAGLTALGQLNAYPKLYLATYFPVLPVTPVLVSYQFEADVEQFYIDSNVEVHIIRRPSSSPQ